MSIIAMLNFDLIPAGANETVGTGVMPPLKWGLDHFNAAYGLTQFATAANYERLGTTMRSADRMANGANSVVVWRSSGNYRPYFRVNPPTQVLINGIQPARTTVGFRFRISNEGATATTYLNGDTFADFFATSTLSLNSNGTLLFLTANTGRVLERNREYYFEVTAEHEGGLETGVAFTPTFTLRIDGEVVSTRQASGFTSGSNRAVHALFGVYRASTADTTVNRQRFLFADIYISDYSGEAPYNGQALGPQNVKLVYPTEVVENEWTLSLGTNPVALIGQGNGRNDAQFLTAPDNDGPSSYRFSFPTNARSIVNGLALFARGKREDGASRPLAGSIKTAGGLELNARPPVALTNSFADHLIASCSPSSVAEAANLKDGVLQNMLFTIKAPIS